MRASKEDFKLEFRQIVKSVIGTKNEEKFIEDMEDATDSIVEALDQKEVIKNNIDLFSTLNSNQETINAMAEVQSISTNHSEKAKNLKEQTMPVKLVEKAFNSIEAIDKKTVLGLPKLEMKKLENSLEKLKLQIDKLFSVEE